MFSKLAGRECLLVSFSAGSAAFLLALVHTVVLEGDFPIAVGIVTVHAGAAAWLLFWYDLSAGHAELLFSLPVGRTDHLKVKVIVGLLSILALAWFSVVLGETRLPLFIMTALNRRLYELLSRGLDLTYDWHVSIVLYPLCVFLMMAGLGLRVRHHRLTRWGWAIVIAVVLSTYPLNHVLSRWLGYGVNPDLHALLLALPYLVLSVALCTRMPYWIKTREVR